ncbi:hypothetical protein GPICK_02935 [Geobacter pickeringii]|uniref:Uncharacterized protein n=1 Tax=Geobacter pickeringii TaxID=345632 RepID=A0A0B5BL51_9BACT|nr:hypothetical protein GPICK_02935 [Geobacter pickeringii]
MSIYSCWFWGAVLLVLAPMSAQAIQCYQCHGTTATSDYRPVDAAYRNLTTGGFLGSHRTHMATGATPTVCTPCHGGRVSTYTTSHRNGFINLTSNVNGSPAKGLYSKGTSFAQSATPTLGTCSSVNCHFETATPTWSSTPFAAPADCNRCHGAAPADGSHPATSGSGKKHGDYYGTTTSSCAKCHPDHTAEATPFSHASSAGNRGLLVRFAAAPNNGAGTYGGNVNYPNYLPSQAPPRNGSCRGLYCHSNGSRGFAPYTSNTTATWGGSLTCTGCHKATGDYINTGSHYAHVFGGGTSYSQIKCSVCHAATAAANMTITSVARHVNNQVDLAFANSSSAANGSYNGAVAKPASPSSKAAGSSYASCQNVYCHSTGQADGGGWPPTYTTPTWGTASTGKCGTCHGTTGSDTHGGFAGAMVQRRISSGSHKKHLSRVYGITDLDMKCAICHAYDKTAFTSSTATCGPVCHVASQPQKHANYEINVNIANYFGATASYNAASLTPGTGYSSCSNVYCHSDGKATPTTYTTPTWGNAASGACGTCHGVTAAAPPASTPHTKHVGSAFPYRFACAECHNGKVQATANATTAPAFVNSTSHVNKTRDVKFDPTNPFGTYSSAVTSCRNLYCHSTGNINVASANLPATYGGSVYARQGWSGTVTCTSCHGRSTSNGMPDYTNAGGAGSATANSHPKHVTSSNIQCVECHEKTTKNGTSIRPTIPSYHVNSGRNVFFNLSGNNASGSYNGTVGQKNCSNTYCHGAGTSLSWGGTTYCNSCHSANDGTSGGGGVNNWGTGVSAHTLHVEDTTTLPWKYTNYSTGNLSGSTTTYRFGCASCHNPAQATHVSGYASSPYRAQVFFGFTAPGKKPTYTYTGTAGTADNGFAWSNGNTVCNQTYCHSNGAGGAGAAVTWATTTNSATNTRCKTCHNYTVASGSPMATGTHSKHINNATYNLSCRKCHGTTTADGTSITDKTKHVNKSVNVAFNNSTTAVNGTYNGLASPTSKNPGSAYASCTNVYCHSKGTSTTPSAAPPNVTPTWGSTLNTTCSGCHGNDSSAAFQMGTVGSVAHAKHVQTYGFGCVKCHAATVSDNRTIKNYANHVTRQVNVAFNNTTTAVNGTYNGSATPTTKLPGSAMAACGNTYCHSNGTSVATTVIPANTSVTWSTAGPLPCTSCHGAGGTTGAPYYSKLMQVPAAYSGGTNWTTPGDALQGNKTFATYAGTTQDALILTNVGYTTAQVADTDTVTGITVIVKGWAASGTTPGNQLNVQLTQNGTTGVGTAKVVSLPGTTSAADAEVYATTTATDLWGTTWTPAQIRATTFGVILKDNDTISSQLNVDLVRIIVHTSKAPKMNNHSSARGHRVATCDICHTSVTYSGGVYTPNAALHVNRSYNVQAALGYTFATNGGTCSTPGNGCHGPTSGKWGGTLGCVDCHNKTITRTKGRPGTTLANVVAEFGLAWGHKKSGRNPVTDDDCCVCHLEGNGTTNKPSAYHQDGNIDLRDPDGAGETPITDLNNNPWTFQRFSTSYAAGSHTSTANNTITNIVTRKFCLACHSANGATNPTARSNNGGTGTATMPFGGINLGANYTVANGAAAAGGLVNVFSQFSSGNSSYHPVRAPLNRDFPTAARMNDPYKPTGTRGTSGTLSNSVIINCFDCHNQSGTPLTLRTIVAHGNAVTLRGYPVAMSGGSPFTASTTPAAANTPTLCIVCHAGYDTQAPHGAGSAWQTNMDGGMAPYVEYACNICHSSNIATPVVRPVRAMDSHGVNVLPTGGLALRSGGRWATTGKPVAFIRNTYVIDDHAPKKVGATTYTTTCMSASGTTNPSYCGNQGTQTYTVGGTY